MPQGEVSLDKTRIEVQVHIRPLKGYWVPKEALSFPAESPASASSSTDATAAECASGISLISRQEVVFKKKKEDPTELKCLWQAKPTPNCSSPNLKDKWPLFEDPQSKKPTPPRPCTPLGQTPIGRSFGASGWMKVLGPEREKKAANNGWQTVLSSKENDGESRSTLGSQKSLSKETTSSGRSKEKTKKDGCRCRYRVRRRSQPSSKRKTSVESTGKDQKGKEDTDQLNVAVLLADRSKKPTFPTPDFQATKLPLPATSKPVFIEEVAVEPGLQHNPLPDDKVHHVLWELKAWAVLLCFWLILFIFRYSTTNED